jgi:hypothetical protein
MACLAACLTTTAYAQSVSTVKQVQVLGNRTPVEIEIEGSAGLMPKTQVLTGPDRLVVDLPNALPAAELHNQTLNRGQVKSVRVSTYSAKPPVTRVVFDLSGPQAYQVFPSGRTVIIKLGAGAVVADAKPASLKPASVKPTSVSPAASAAKLVTSNYPVQAVPATPPAPQQAPPQKPPLTVNFKNGQLTVSANKATLSEILFAIHQRTGAEIAIPAGAEQEQVVAELGPALPAEVLSSLLTGSKFNFLILSAANDPSTLDRVILSPRPEGPAPAYRPLPPVPVQTAAPQEEDDAESPAKTAPPSPAPHPNPGADANGGQQSGPDSKGQDNSQD